jgi:hypothetical protein
LPAACGLRLSLRQRITTWREIGRYALVVIGARVGEDCATDPIAEFIERACGVVIVRQARWSPGFGAQFVPPVDRRPVALKVGPHRRVVRVCFHEQTAKIVNEHTEFWKRMVGRIRDYEEGRVGQ